MKLYKIRNEYLFDSDKPKGFHTYAVYYDKQNKRYNAIQTTHLYTKDENRFRQVRRGNIAIAKFKEFDVPSGIKNSYFSQNKNGTKINVNDKYNVIPISSRHLSKKQSDFLKSFARREEKNKKNPHR